MSELDHAPATLIGRRTVEISGLAVLLAVVAAFVAQILTALIALVTNAAFYGRFSTVPVSPAGNHLGSFVIVVPVLGAFVVGVMARYGSAAIRGHGIPEAMERVLEHESRIPARLTLLKPLSAAIAIGTGGPFGAEGPIIATGSSLGSLLGQWLPMSARERKTLLAAGAAAGMSATFGSPVAAVLLAIELLLFEWSPRSIVPVALASATAAGVRLAMVGGDAVFPMPAIANASGGALLAYVVVGAVIGAVAVGVTRAVYAVEDAFEKLPMHWMWWPAIGAVVVGVVGYFAPRTMGVGYDNIEAIVSGHLIGSALVVLCTLKFVSWVIALGSGTSGGTLAPLFTIGGGLGGVLGAAIATLLPSLGVDPRVAALVGMAAMFSGASHAVMTSIVFAFETTRQPATLLPLLGGCMAAYLIAATWMRHSIMTTKIARRGVRIPLEFEPDALAHVTSGAWTTRPAVSLLSSATVKDARAMIETATQRYAAYPVCDEDGRVVGVITSRDLANAPDDASTLESITAREPLTVRDDHPLSDAIERMHRGGVGSLPVVSANGSLVGVISRRDVLAAWRKAARPTHV